MSDRYQTVILCDDDAPVVGEDLLLADGFEEAFIGAAMRFGWTSPVAIYDYERCIRILTERDGMDRSAAEEYFGFNVLGAWVGDQTPIFVVGTDLPGSKNFLKNLDRPSNSADELLDKES